MIWTVGVVLWALSCVAVQDGLPAPELAPPVSAEELLSRRVALARAIEEGLVVVDGVKDPAVESYHANKNDRDFFYLTGVNLPEAKMLLDVRGGRGDAVLFLPARSASHELWHGARLYPGADASRITAIDTVLPLANYDEELKRRLARKPKVWVGGEELPRRRQRAADTVDTVHATLASRYPGGVGFERYAPHVHRLRQIKSDYEVRMLRLAIAITHRAFDRVIPAAKPGMYEFQIEAMLEGEFRFHGSEAPGFDSIVGSGPRSCVLHYHHNSQLMKRGEVLLMDVGAQGGAYTADISRTIPLGLRFTTRQREVYGWVLEAQRAAIAAVKPGVTMRELNQVVRRMFEARGCVKNLPHGITHHVGLDVHDVSADRELAPGMVITIEPGLYFADEQLGVRIEDMILVTTDGCEVLTSSIPKSVDAIEQWRSAGQSPRRF